MAKLAARYRNKFKRSVLIDIVGYRKNGHNESDNPFFTQPKMYRKISHIENVFEKYAKKLRKMELIQPSALDVSYIHTFCDLALFDHTFIDNIEIKE